MFFIMSDNKEFKNFVVANTVKFYVHSIGGRSEGAVVEKINSIVKKTINDGMDRAKSNGRTTLMAKDL